MRRKIFKILINERLRHILLSNLKSDNIIRIKEYLKLDKTQQITIKTIERTFLSN